jgi:hypothetical protein
MLIDERGEHRQRIRNGEVFAKPRGWRTTLVPSDDAVKVTTVRWLFQTYADTDTGLRSVADQLNARGIPGPSGGPWFAASIKAILENRNYTGTFTWAKRREGKYHSVSAGHIKERDRSEVTLSPSGKPHAVDNPREAWIVVENAHEALIDKSLFERVQTKLHDRRRSKEGQAYRTHTRGNGDAYLLSGLVFCAHCGCKMHGNTLVAKGHEYPKYICSTYARSGKRNLHGCGCHGVPQGQLVDVLVRKLQRALWQGDNLDRLKAALRRQLKQRGSAPKTGIEALGKQIANLDREIDQAAENFLRAPAEVLDLVGSKLTAMKRQRTLLQDELERAEAANRPLDVEAEVDAIAGRLWRLGEEMAQADPARRREVFRLLVDRIELRFDQIQKGKRTECPLNSGEIYLRTGQDSIFGSVSRGDWI